MTQSIAECHYPDIVLFIVLLSVFMLNVIILRIVLYTFFVECQYYENCSLYCYAECHYAAWRYEECHFAVCHYVECHSVTMLNFVTKNGIILSDMMLN